MKSILNKYLIIVLPSIAGILIILAIFIYETEKNSLKNGIQDLSIQIINSRSEQVSVWLKSITLELKQVSQKKTIETMEWDNMKDDLISFAKERSDTYSFLFVCFPDGSYYTTKKGRASANISDREYFINIMKKNNDYDITNPLISRSTGEKTINLAVPIKNNDGDVIGCLVGSVKLETLSSIASKMKIAETGFGFIIDSKGVVTAHPKTEYLLKMNVLDSDTMGFKNLNKVGEKMIKGRSGIDIIIRPDNVEEMLVYTTIPFSHNWTMGIAVPTKEVFSEINRLLIIIIIGFSFTLIITCILILTLSKKIIINPIKNIVKMLNVIKDGDLSRKIEISGQGEIKELYFSIESMIEKWKEIILTVNESADTVNIGTGQISQIADKIAQGANEQAASSEEISASIEEMVATINQNTENSQITEQIAIKAEQGIIKGQEATKETLDRMRDIANRISIINEISEKTDLLAINAAIEASKAGEFGKGFSVVASEIRKLAENSKKAANKIVELANSSVVIADQADDLFTEIVPDVRNTAKLVREITAASCEQNTTANQISKAIQEFSSVVQQNASTAEQLSTRAEELSGQSMDLTETVNYFKLKEQSTEITQLQNELMQSFSEIFKKNRNNKMNDYEISIKPKIQSKEEPIEGIKLDLNNNHEDNKFEKY